MNDLIDPETRDADPTLPRHPDAPEAVGCDCPECGAVTTFHHVGEAPVTARSGAYGKYVAAIYECRKCGHRTEGHPITGRWSL